MWRNEGSAQKSESMSLPRSENQSHSDHGTVPRRTRPGDPLDFLTRANERARAAAVPTTRFNKISTFRQEAVVVPDRDDVTLMIGISRHEEAVRMSEVAFLRSRSTNITIVLTAWLLGRSRLSRQTWISQTAQQHRDWENDPSAW